MEESTIKKGLEKHPTQCARLLAHIELFGGISTMEAIIDLGIVNPAARVSELKARGIAVKTDKRAAVNRFGEPCYYAYYTLDKGGNNG